MNYDDHVLLEYILNARQPVSVKDILSHLMSSIDGYAEGKKPVNVVKNIQNRVKSIEKCEHFSRLIEVTVKGKTKLYKGVRVSSDTDTAMKIDEACALLMSDKHLSELAPTRLFQGQDEYQNLIERADAVVRKHQHTQLIHNNHVSDFLKRVAVMQRGQSLIGARVDNTVLETISACILKKKCISLEYNDKRRVLHPFGLVFRQPKIYLLAVDTETLRMQGAGRVRPRQYLCNRIHNAKISPQAHEVPDNFDADDYVNKGRLDVLAYADKDSGPRSFTLKLRIRQSGNLVKDLREYPLSANQRITNQPDSNYFTLEAAGMRATHSLVEWIMGRLDRVEVISPKHFREHIKDQVAGMYQLYNS